MPRKRLPHTEIMLPNGQHVNTDLPATFGLKRTIIQHFLPTGLNGMNVFYDFENGTRNRSQSFDLKKAIDKAKRSQEENLPPTES